MIPAAQVNALTTPSSSPLHGGRIRCTVVSWRFLAFVSPPVQGGAGGGSCFFILNFTFYIFIYLSMSGTT